MKLEPPPDPRASRAEAEALKGRLEREGWIRPNHTQRTGLSTHNAVAVMRSAGAPFRLERTGRWQAAAGSPLVELWMPPWVLRIFRLYTGRKQDLIVKGLALLVSDEEMRAAFFALADLGHVDEGRLLVRRALAAQPAVEGNEPMDWTAALMVKGFYVVCERGDDDQWARSGTHHTTKQDANAAARGAMERVGYLRVAMLDRTGAVMKLPRPRVRFPKSQ